MPVGNGGDRDVDLPPTSPPVRVPRGTWIGGDVLKPYVGERLKFRDEQGNVLVETQQPISSVDDFALCVGSAGNYQAILLQKGQA